jgi:PAP_fibrillin
MQRLTVLLLLGGVDVSFSFVGVKPPTACNERARSATMRPPEHRKVDTTLLVHSPTNFEVRTSRAELKERLLDLIKDFRSAQDQDGAVSIDFGVRGGEINATSRAPQKVDYYAISPRVGQAADAIVAHCDVLAQYNPTDEPTLYLGDRQRGSESPLEGTWKLLFTTAADASFSKNSTRGEATAKNVVDASRGRITNVIDFKDRADGTTPVLKQLNVVIQATPESKNRVALRFRYAKAVLTKFLFFPIRWSLYIPVPAPFITRLIVLFYRIFRRKKAKAPPKAYFDVLYLDDTLRIHRTGEDNLFVQARPAWVEAASLFE